MRRHLLASVSATGRDRARPASRNTRNQNEASTSASFYVNRHYSSDRPQSDGSIVIGRHVKEALANGCPVVALESTVITHGLPEPQNLVLAIQLEREIYDGLWWDDQTEHAGDNPMKGVVTPATVGIVKGQLVVGLSHDELEFLAKSELSQPIKASRRDIPVAQALKLSAGTTVSATMAIATSCTQEGIHVFATGGLGGVHLGGENSMDISADLYEMMHSPIGLVSSGFKSFLDTRRSLELLETLGCTVTSMKSFEGIYLAKRHYSQDDNRQNDLQMSTGHSVKFKTSQPFPGFFTAVNKEQVRSPWQCDTVKEAAQILYHCIQKDRRKCSIEQANNICSDSLACSAYQADNSKRSAGICLSPGWLRNSRAMLLACPIPVEFSLDDTTSSGNSTATDEKYSRELLDRISSEIDKRQDLSGNEKTPLILAELNRLTGGKTLEANLALLRNNARVGAHLAYEYSGLCQRIAGVGGKMTTPTTCDNAERRTGEKAIQHETRDCGNLVTTQSGSQSNNSRQQRHKSPIVVGCTMIDMHVRTEMDNRFKANPPFSGATFHGRPRMILGGVGRNLAAALELLGQEPTFITSLADDNLGDFARNEMHKLLAAGGLAETKATHTTGDRRDGDKRMGRAGLATRLKVIEWRDVSGACESSSCFALVLIDSITGQCEFVIANLEANRALSRQNLVQEQLELVFEQKQTRPPLVILDGNLPADTIEYMLELGSNWQVPVFVEPTDVVCLPELVRLLAGLSVNKTKPDTEQASDKLKALAYMSPNVIELETMLELFGGSSRVFNKEESARSSSLTVDGIEEMARELMETHLPELTCLLVTMDRRGLLVGLRTDEANIDHAKLIGLPPFGAQHSAALIFKHYLPSELIERPVSASGAGDCFAAGFISGLINGLPLKECVEVGFNASSCALKDTSTVPDSLRMLNVIKGN